MTDMMIKGIGGVGIPAGGGSVGKAAGSGFDDLLNETMVEVRNRLINAYEEIMRMSI
ncbi:MAG: Flagellar hook-basal body complex protein FliE [Deltaproteobacteria bacterium]|nr:Flagellar hook-basal body complex protein FliE [Deltaproteobacteria bacterium]